MKKTSFEATTFDGGCCFFYLEDVKSAELLAETTCFVTNKAIGERVRVDLLNNSMFLLKGCDYERLVDRLRAIDGNVLPELSPPTLSWLSKFDNLQTAVEEREMYHAESGMNDEAGFDAEDDTVYAELSLLVAND